MRLCWIGVGLQANFDAERIRLFHRALVWDRSWFQAIGQTVWVFFIMKLLFFFFFFFAELALAGIECRAPVSDPPRDPLVHLRP